MFAISIISLNTFLKNHSKILFQLNKKKLAKNIFFFTFCSYALDLWKIRPIQLYKICLTLIISQFIHAVYVGLQNYRIILILVNECHFSNSAHILVSAQQFVSLISVKFFFFICFFHNINSVFSLSYYINQRVFRHFLEYFSLFVLILEASCAWLLSIYNSFFFVHLLFCVCAV